MLETLVRATARLPVAALAAVTAGLSFGESAFLVEVLVPGDASMIFMGTAGAERGAPMVLVVVACAVGALLGDSLGYLVGRRWGWRLMCRWGWMERLVAPKLARAEELVQRRGGMAVFVARWLSALRALVPVVAGTSRMSYLRFLAWDAVAAVTWSTAVVGIGYLVGRPAVRFVDRFEWTVPLVVAACLVAWWGVARARRPSQPATS